MGCSGTPAEKKSIGIQLYTFRNKIRKDSDGTSHYGADEIKKVLAQIADVGFKELEVFDYKDRSIFGIPYIEFNGMVTDSGMRISSGHYKTGQVNPDWEGTLVKGWENAVDDAKRIGQEYINIAWIDPSERESIDAYKRICELMNNANLVCKQSGVKLGYHNHEFEFDTLEGQVPYDVMLQELDPSISMEMDLYWITRAGKNPLDYFAKYPGRFEQWHVKDMSKADPKVQTDVGSGTIDFKSIFANKEQSGLKRFYLEQEDYPVSEIQSVKKGFEYLQSL
jgi:sugar phosphate isomerase/epimerase